MTDQCSPDIAGALKLAYHELKQHEADYHHRTSVEVNNKIIDALASLQPDAASTTPKPMAAEMLALAEKLKYARHSRIVHGVRVDLDYPEMDLARDALRYFADAAQGSSQPRWRHKKRGTTYTEIGRANLQIATDPIEEDDRVVIYRSDADGRLWVRGEAEFQDGRFEALPMTSTEDK